MKNDGVEVSKLAAHEQIVLTVVNLLHMKVVTLVLTVSDQRSNGTGVGTIPTLLQVSER